MKVLSVLLCVFCGLMLYANPIVAQSPGSIKGTVKDEFNKPISDVLIIVPETDDSTISDEYGKFKFVLPPARYVLDIQIEGFDNAKRQVTVRPGATEVLYVVLKGGVEIETQYITDENDPKGFSDETGFEIIPIKTREITKMPSFKPDLSNVLATLPGVSVNNEFSSQYRVRGGNFDENLIYVNDIEIYRPFLIRSGQQEGLGFVNPNLAADVKFSTGGFASKYADKLSSVLDVTYKNPHEVHGSAEVGIVNLNFHIEGSSRNRVDSTRAGRFTYLIGARRFSTTYLLNSLDTQGDYQPTFYDTQGMFTFSPKQKRKEPKYIEKKNGKRDTLYYPAQRIKISTFFNIASNEYRFIPSARETQFGTVQSVLRLRVAFEGREVTSYLTGLGALVLEHKPHSRLRFKYIVTAFRSVESETFDVEGGYWLSDINTSFGNEGFNEVIFDRGIGTNFKHARNFLEADVIAAEQRATWFPGKNFRHQISWGVRGQRQMIDDEIVEWNGVDSAGYFELQESIRSKATINSNLLKVYFQDNWKLNKKNTQRIIFGGRAIYNDLNNEFIFAPRLQYVIDPTKATVNTDTMTAESFRKWKKSHYQLHFAVGMYNQPAFYREMRDLDGNVNTDIKAQSSIHFVAGGDYLFEAWGRPFKFYGEIYYKYLYNVIPYEIDNVRIRYYPNNPAKAYAYGIDLKVNGEFIRDVDSWVSFSMLKTMENVEGDGQGYVPRPTDQRFQIGMYFQDELPVNPTFKAHINVVYGSGLRIGPPKSLANRTAFKAPAYTRVDLGFSKVVVFKSYEERNGKFGLESLWFSVEIFNLFQRANTVSYTWIKDVFNTQFAVPNFLSARLVNARIIARF